MTTSKIMIGKEERKESMQKNLEASNASLMAKASSFSFGEVRNTMVFPGINCDNIPADLGISDQSITGEASGAMYLGYSTPVYHQDVFMWPGFYSNALMQHNHMNAFNGHFYLPNQEYVYPLENRNQLPLKMVTHNYPLEVQFQEFQYFVVIDFEATCDKDKSPDPQEIIEFPSVLVNSMTGELEASFQTYVRPTYHAALSEFCKQLTGIQQIQVDRGVSLSEALLMHDKWLEEKGIKHKNFAIVTWSNWDCRVMLESECKLKRIRKPPYFNRWINLKVPFQQVFGDVRCNLKGAIQLAGLTWEGRAHCGLDDARNTARLLVLIMCWGFPLTITNSLACHALECSSTSPDHCVGSPQPFGKPKGVTAADLQFQLTRYCFCGVKCSKCVVRKPGPTQGRWFFGCGNWTASRRAACNYFVWAS